MSKVTEVPAARLAHIEAHVAAARHDRAERDLMRARIDAAVRALTAPAA